MTFPSEYSDLLSDSSKALLFLATLMPDGSPQVTPVWFSAEDEYILINTAVGRAKERNMRLRTRVAVTIQDPNDDFRYLGMRGEIVTWTTEGAEEHINLLSLKYRGEAWKKRPEQTRIIFKFKPVHFDCH
jgi:PPOX class probable F420-dependent enzyme